MPKHVVAQKLEKWHFKISKEGFLHNLHRIYPSLVIILIILNILDIFFLIVI